MGKIHSTGPAAGAVAELQGLYGAYIFPEKLLQKIWLRGDYNRTDVRTVDGRPVEVIYPGRWNVLGGPDFRGARLRIAGGREVVGDVEVHVRSEDWVAHAHASNPAYDRVVLHVVLFPPDPLKPTRSSSGLEIPTVVMLPLLQQDLEQFAAEEVVEGLSGRMGGAPPDELAALADGELAALLRRHALERWRQKVHFADARIPRLGWSAACHHAALEILGYRFNRAPMLRVASRWPVEEWGRAEFNPGEALASEEGAWSLQGVRPANQPRWRLQQYAAWVKRMPDWPDKLRALGSALGGSEVDVGAETASVRRSHRLKTWRAAFVGVVGSVVGGTRLHTLACDGFLPLLAAGGATAGGGEGIWFHWWPGDQPPCILACLRQLGATTGRGRPACHGLAQGLIGWQISRDSQR